MLIEELATSLFESPIRTTKRGQRDLQGREGGWASADLGTSLKGTLRKTRARKERQGGKAEVKATMQSMLPKSNKASKEIRKRLGSYDANQMDDKRASYEYDDEARLYRSYKKPLTDRALPDKGTNKKG